MIYSKISIKLIFLVTTITFTSATTQRASYGEPCDQSIRCDSKSSLTCRGNICQCIFPDTMEFEKATRKCTVILGEKCVYTAVNEDGQGEERSWKEEFSCVAHATCKTGFCLCDERHYESSNNTCLPQRSFNETCENISACRIDKHLVCHQETSTCQCNSTLSIYDKTRQTCSLKAGAPCIRNDRINLCVANAYCVKNPLEENLGHSYTCTCSQTFFNGENGTCELKREHGEPCKLDNYCKPQFICGADETCQCNQTSQVYEHNSKKCVGLVTFPCDSQPPQCVPNAKCEKSKCVCNPEFQPSHNGSCLANYESSCENHWTRSCNQAQGLTCLDGSCICKYPNFQTFEKNLKKCVSIVDGPCDEDTPCRRNAHCSDERGYRRCHCNKGFVAVNHYCMISYGEECIPGATGKEFSCDSLAPLQCIEGICNCGSLEIYDKALMKCRGIVGSKCSPNESLEKFCVDGAACVPLRVSTDKWSKPHGVCECKVGLATTDKRLCTLNEEEEL